MILTDIKYIENDQRVIAGVDEVGRGPLCGPVVASAVILPHNLVLNDVNDSKKLSPKKREILFDIIKKEALSVGIGVVHEQKIDEVNILEATIIAMRLAIENLDISPELLLVDGNMKDISNIPQKNIIRGDSKSLSIAAASIIAKVTRDRMMFQYAKVFPGYGLAKNMGYGTKEHISAIKKNFSTPIHRRSFKPVFKYMPKFKDIKDIDTLRIQIAASEMVKLGHKIIYIKDHSLNIIDILSLFNASYHAFKLQKEDEELISIKDLMIKEAEDTLILANIKKDITSSINISVISVQFSKNKSEVVFKEI